MPLFYELRFPSNVLKNDYSQGHAVNTAIIGYKAAVGETRGTLIVLKQGGGRGPEVVEPFIGPLIPGQVQRITIRVPDEKLPIEVDAVLCNQEITVDAILTKHKYEYDDIKVYSIDEVEIYD